MKTEIQNMEVGGGTPRWTETSEESISEIVLENGFTKPVFEEMVFGEIVNVKMMQSIQTREDRRGNAYTPFWLQVTVENKEGTPWKTVDNYGGLAKYNDGHWFLGPNSHLFSLKTKFEKAFAGGETVSIPTLKIGLLDKGVGVMTQDTSFGKVESQKNLIMQFKK